MEAMCATGTYSARDAGAGQAYPNLIHYNKLENGGHFVARE